MISATKTGLYQPGETVLHRIDPRLKVIVTLIVIALTFAASSWIQLLLFAVIFVFLLCLAASVSAKVWRMLWMLRWLLLFTLMMHLLFSPGRTLWGVSWLSYDGLLTGVYVSMQLLLSVMAAASMVLTTPVTDLIGAFGWYLSPLYKLGVNTDNWLKTLLMALNFIPIVQHEMQHVKESADEDRSRGLPSGRWSSWANKVKVFTLRLVNRGDEVAHELVEEDNLLQTCELRDFFPLSILDRLFVFSLIVVLGCYWFLGALA